MPARNATEAEDRKQTLLANFKVSVEAGKVRADIDRQSRLARHGRFAERARDASAEESQEALVRFAESEKQGLRTKTTVWSTADFESLSTLGEGGFGVVHLVRRRGTDEHYALKQVRKSGYSRKSHRERAFAERDILAESPNRWFVELYATFQDDKYVYMVMEFLQGGDLIGRLIERQRFTAAETAFYMAELLEALDTVHRCGFVHRDVKPDNAVLDSKGHLKLLDFGLCRVEAPPPARDSDTSLRAQKKSVVGTPQYLAPEGFKGDFGKASDLWALGIMTYECLVGRVPFDAGRLEGPKAHQLIQQKVACHNRPIKVQQHDGSEVLDERGYLAVQLDKVRAKISLTAASEGILRGLICDKRSRLTAEQCRRQPFFSGIDFARVHEMQPPFVPELNGPDDARCFDDDFDRYPLPAPQPLSHQDGPLEWAHYEFDRIAYEAQRPNTDVETFFPGERQH